VHEMNEEVPGLSPKAGCVNEMLDKFALQQLVWTYAHAVDRRDFGLLRSLYHDDGFDDHGAHFSGNPDDFVIWLRQSLAAFEATSHLIANMLFIVCGNAADGEIVTTAYHRSTGNEPMELIAGGRYLDRYVRRDGIWRFMRRSFVMDWTQARPVPPADGPSISGGVAQGRPGADDPAFTRLPLFARDRARRV
jgi:hypothetical protein